MPGVTDNRPVLSSSISLSKSFSFRHLRHPGLFMPSRDDDDGTHVHFQILFPFS